MNEITLIGELTAAPSYHCTTAGHDLARFELRTDTPAGHGGPPQTHHCVVWGPGALDLHAHLHRHDRLLVRGELRYRSGPRRAGSYRIPVVHVRAYSYLGQGETHVITPARQQLLLDVLDQAD